MKPAIGVEERDLLRWAAAVERRSEHPLAAALVAAAQERGGEVAPAERFAMAPGRGVEGWVGGRRVLVGTATWLEENGVDAAALAAERRGRPRPGGRRFWSPWTGGVRASSPWPTRSSPAPARRSGSCARWGSGSCS